MFKKYTAWAAAMMLAAGTATASAECAWQANQTCNPTRECYCTTCSHAITTCSQFCTTCCECNATCGIVCSSIPLPEPTAVPLPAPTSRPPQQPSATQSPSTGDDYTTQSPHMQEEMMANLLNQDRKNNGLGVLALDAELCRIARIKSADMRDNGYFAHESPTYGRIGDMLKRFGYPFSAAGENIAHHADVNKAQAAFMSSQGHRKNILSTTWTKMGIGIVTDANGYIYATQIFAK